MAITNCVESWGGKGTSTLAVEETCTSSTAPILLSAASGNRIHPGRGVAASSGLRKPHYLSGGGALTRLDGRDDDRDNVVL